MQQEFVRFEGNCPRNVSKDAKYGVRSDDGKYVVGVIYRTAFREEWRPVTRDHPELVEMVNAVKVAQTGSAGGAFYINEYGQVIVPMVGERDYYLAGEYHQPLTFEFEGHILSGDALDLDGQPVQPGGTWAGPHPGIPYVLKAGGGDIYYKTEPRPRVTREVRLSDFQDAATVRRICRMVAAVKGHQGGRFYINEFRQLFAPVSGENGLEYIYIGRLDSLDDWFPKPHAELAVEATVSIRREIAQLGEMVGDEALAQRALLELLAAKAVVGRHGGSLDEALDMLAQTLDIHPVLAEPAYQALKEQLAPQVMAWDLPGSPERVETAAAVLDVLSSFQETGIYDYPEWLVDILRFLADETYPLLFVDLGASLLPVRILVLMDRPEISLLEGSQPSVEAARLLMALRDIEPEQAAASIRVSPAVQEDTSPFSGLENDVFGAVYINLLGHLNQPRLRRRLTEELPRFLADRLASDGRAMLLMPPSLLTAMAWDGFRRELTAHLDIQAVVDLSQPLVFGGSVAPALVILRRPKQPLTQRKTLFAPLAGEELPPETALSQMVAWLPYLDPRPLDDAEPIPAPPVGFYTRPTAELADRWDPRFNSPARQQLQDALITDPNVNWLEGVTKQIARGTQPGTLQRYMEARLAGVTFEGRQETITGLREGDTVWLRREPDNPHDPNAVHVERRSGASLGYLPANVAAEVAEDLEQLPDRHPAIVVQVRGRTQEKPAHGVTIHFAPPQYANAGKAITFIRPRDVANNQIAGTGEQAWLLETDRGRVQILQAGDILLNLYNYAQACVVPSSFAGDTCHHALAIIRPAEEIDSLYLLSFILGSEFQQQLDFVARGDRGERISLADLKELLVIVPPLADQRRIAWAFAESQGDLGPERGSGMEKSLHLAREAGLAHSRWLASSVLSNLFGDWDEIHSLDDWLRLKGDYIRQLRNTVAHGQASFEEGALNQTILSLEDLRRALEAIYKAPEPAPGTMDQADQAMKQLRKDVSGVADGFIRGRLMELLRLLGNLLRARPVALPLSVDLLTETLPAGRSALLQLQITNVSEGPLYELEVIPALSTGEVVEKPIWRVDQLDPTHTHIFEARLRFELSGLVQIIGDVHYVLHDVPETRALPPLELEVVPQEQLPFSEIRPNPYITGLPVDNPEMFFGREDVLDYLRENLIGAHQKNVIILQGNRRTGKTSILKQIVARDWFAPHIPVYVDCQGLGLLTNKRFFYKLARETQKTLKRRRDVPEPPAVRLDDISEEDPFYDFRETLDALIPPGRQIILLIDEFELIDKAIRDGDLDGVVLENLRHLLQHNSSVGAVFTGSYRLSRLREEYWSILFGIGLKHQIGFLDERAARQLITEPLRDQVEYASNAAARILQLTSGQPLLVQMVCHNVVNLLNEQRTGYVTLQIVEDAAQKTLVSASDQLSNMFNTAGSPAARAVLVFMAQELGQPEATLPLHEIESFIDKRRLPLSDTALVEALREMSERDVVRIDGTIGQNRYGFKIDLLREWIRRYQDLKTAVDRAIEEPSA